MIDLDPLMVSVDRFRMTSSRRRIVSSNKETVSSGGSSKGKIADVLAQKSGCGIAVANAIFI